MPSLPSLHAMLKLALCLRQCGSVRPPSRTSMALSGQQPPRYRPWEQQDLLSRLQTFKPRSWFGKSAQISAVTCARHGWINNGPDNLQCEVSTEYAGRLVSGHTDSCPWRDTVCEANLGKFPKLPARDVFVEFEQRYSHVNRLSHLPPLTGQAIDNIKDSSRDDLAVVLKRQLQAQSRMPYQSTGCTQQQMLVDLSQGIAENGSDAFVRRACLLAACGWDACQLSSLVLGGRSPQHTAGLPAGACEMQQSVLGCSMCGARAGLWSFADQPELQNSAEHSQPGAAGEGGAEKGPSASALTADTGPAAANDSTPARRNSIKRDLSRTIAGGPLVNPDSAVTTSEEPRRLPAFGAPRVPQTAASTSRPFGSPFPHAPFGSPLSDQPEGSVMGSAVGSAPRHAPFGSPLQAPAFGSGSISPSSSFANEAFFTPAATANPRGQHAAPDSTAAAGNAAFGTPGTVYGTPGSAPGTPLSGFGSPAYHTPAARAGDHTPGMFGSGVHGTPASVSQYGTPAAGITTPGLALRGPKLTDAHADTPGVGAVGDGAASGPFGAPAFGSSKAMPAFGMAVFKSPRPSRSPSVENTRPTPSAPPAIAMATAAAGSATAVDPAAAIATSSLSGAQAADPGNQPSGSKRKRGDDPVVSIVDLPTSSKQVRLGGSPPDNNPSTATPTGPSFHLLRSHKSFCPWVAAGKAEAGSSDAVCGWKWCLSSLAAHWDQDTSDHPEPSEGQSQRLQQAQAGIDRG